MFRLNFSFYKIKIYLVLLKGIFWIDRYYWSVSEDSHGGVFFKLFLIDLDSFFYIWEKLLSHFSLNFTLFNFIFELCFNSTKSIQVLLDDLKSLLDGLMSCFPFHGLLIFFEGVLFFILDGFLKLKGVFSQLITLKVDLGNLSELLSLLRKRFDFGKLLCLEYFVIFGKKVFDFVDLLLFGIGSIDFSQSLFEIFSVIFFEQLFFKVRKIVFVLGLMIDGDNDPFEKFVGDRFFIIDI